MWIQLSELTHKTSWKCYITFRSMLKPLHIHRKPTYLECAYIINCGPFYQMISFCARFQTEIQLKISVRWILFWFWDFHKIIIVFLNGVLYVLWKFSSPNEIVVMISGPIHNCPNVIPQTLKADFSISYFSIT